MPETKIFQDGQVNEARRAHPVTIRIRAPVADQVESQFALRTFDAPVSFANWRTEAAELYLWVHHWSGWYLFEGLFQDFDAFAHFQDAHHEPVVGIAVIPQRHPELELWLEPI